MKKLFALLALSLSLSGCAYLDELAQMAEEEKAARLEKQALSQAQEEVDDGQPFIVFEGYSNGVKGIVLRPRYSNVFIARVESLTEGCYVEQHFYSHIFKDKEDFFIPTGQTAKGGDCRVDQVMITTPLMNGIINKRGGEEFIINVR